MARRYIVVPRVKGRSLLGFVSDHRVVMILHVPERPLNLPECRLTYVPANSGTPYVLFSAKGHAEILSEF